MKPPSPTAQLQPTPHPDVNAVLHEMLAAVQDILGDHFLGMYLDGSLALGDFNPQSSDIDYVVVTDVPLSDELFTALQAMHARFNGGDSPWATEVEAFYVPAAALRHLGPTGASYPRIERGPHEVLRRDEPGSSWLIHLQILREHGITVAGPESRSLIDPVDPQDLGRAMAELMETWWGPMCEDTRPQLRYYIGYHAYTVLTMCRILYTLDTGDVTSKPAAARWAQHALGGHWSALIERALAWRKDLQTPPPPGDVAETLDLIQFTLARCRS